ncbi:MAG TPA: stage V sporulation protein AC [Lachnospiraceae bacterium]|jgi:stage V sporulation protein AC|nr:stage V sporulation protein AC [Lachnospiraceae bacterium]
MEENNKSKQEYSKMVDMVSPNSSLVMNCIKAFVVGGLICVAGEAMNKSFSNYNFTKDEVSLLVNVVLIGATALLTGLGLFSKLGKFSGAGTFVPITGFANSMVSPAIEFKKEGWVFGMAAKMFTVAGPVIVYGLVTSMVVGFIYFVAEKVM